MYSIVVPITDIKGEKNKDQLDKLLTTISTGGYVCPILACFDSCHEDFIEYFTNKYSFITPVINDGNRLNFARNVNLGLKYSLSNYPDNHVVIINQDSMLPVSEHFQFMIREDVPCICSASSVDISGDPVKVQNALNTLNVQAVKGYFKTLQKIPFYCVFIHREVLEKLGGLDGVYVASFEDDDYCTRSVLAGFDNYISSVKVYHEGTHIDTNVGNFESASGSYTLSRLGVNMTKYCTKYQIHEPKLKHEDMIEWVLANRKWDDKMKINLEDK